MYFVITLYYIYINGIYKLKIQIVLLLVQWLVLWKETLIFFIFTQKSPIQNLTISSENKYQTLKFIKVVIYFKAY